MQVDLVNTRGAVFKDQKQSFFNLDEIVLEQGDENDGLISVLDDSISIDVQKPWKNQVCKLTHVGSFSTLV